MHLFSYAKNHGFLSSFESAGATEVPHSVNTFCMVMALVSYLPEGFLAGLLADNRLLRQSEVLEGAMQDELMQLEQLSPGCWQALSGHLAVEAVTLRHLVLWGSHIVYAYMDLKIFSVISEMPWCLARGDIAANLEALRANTEPPQDPFSRKIWALLVSGYPFYEILAAVELWSSASFTSHLTETLHASAALVRRHHPDSSRERLTQRAFLHIMRFSELVSNPPSTVHGGRLLQKPLLCCLRWLSLSPGTATTNIQEQRHLNTEHSLAMRRIVSDNHHTMSEQHAARLRSRLQRLRRKRPSHITGRQVFLSDMCMKAKVSNLERERTGQKLLSRKEVMRLHGEYWEALPADKKQDYEKRAHSLRGEREEELRDLIEEQASAVQRAQAEVEQEKANRSDSMMLWPCKLSADETSKLQDLLNGDGLSKKVVKELSAKSAFCPQPLSETAFQSLLRDSPLPVPPPASSSALALVVARGRASLHAAAIAVEVGGQTTWYRFLAALLNPARVLLQPLVPQDVPAQPQLGLTKKDWEQKQQSDYTHIWSYEAGSFSTQAIFEDLDISQCKVVTPTIFKGPGLITSNAPVLPLEHVLDDESMPEHTEKSEKARRTQPASASAAVPQWLEALFSQPVAGTSLPASSSAMAAPQVGAAAQQGPRPPSTTKRAASPPASESSSDDLSDGAEAELAQQRQELAESREVMNLHFRVAVLGGTWQVQRTGRSIYGLRCDIKATSPLHGWAQELALARSASFEYNVYGEQGAADLAAAWRERLLFLHRLSAEPGGVPDLGSTPFQLPEELQTKLEALSGRARKRYLQITQMKPNAWSRG